VEVLATCERVGGGGSCLHKRKRDARAKERRSLWWRGREVQEESLGRGGGRLEAGRDALSVVERETGVNEKNNE